MKAGSVDAADVAWPARFLPGARVLMDVTYRGAWPLRTPDTSQTWILLLTWSTTQTSFSSGVRAMPWLTDWWAAGAGWATPGGEAVNSTLPVVTSATWKPMKLSTVANSRVADPFT